MKIGTKIVAALLTSLTLSAATAFAAPRPVSEQIQILTQTANSGQEGGWFVSPEKDANWNRWFYSVTDLDQDGRLEIFKAKRRGENSAPELRCEELLDQGGRVWGLFFVGGSDVPDIMTSEAATAPAVFCEAAENRYHYIFLSSVRADEEAWDFIDTKVALTLSGDLQIEELALRKGKLPAPGSDWSERQFFLPAWVGAAAEGAPAGPPEEISAERYNNIAKERFPGARESFAAISWYRAEEIQRAIGLAELARTLENSYRAFADSGNP